MGASLNASATTPNPHCVRTDLSPAVATASRNRRGGPKSSLSSVTAGGSRSSRWRRRDSASSPPTCAGYNLSSRPDGVAHLGAGRWLPRPRPSRARPRRRAQPGPRRAPARRVALGASRRGRARHTAAHRLFRARPAGQGLTKGLRQAPGALAEIEIAQRSAPSWWRAGKLWVMTSVKPRSAALHPADRLRVVARPATGWAVRDTRV